MKKITFILFMFCFAITGAIAQEQITISRFQGEKITGIEVHGAFKVTARQGESTGASVTIPARLEKQLNFTLKQDGILLITFEGKIKGKNNEKFTAEVNLSALENVELTGASSLTLTGEITANNFKAKIVGASAMKSTDPIRVNQEAEIHLAGASKISGELTAPVIAFRISGASNLTLAGKSTEGNIEVNGASRANLDNFRIDNATIEASGSSHVNINVVKELSAKASGVSSITYSGNPKIIKLDATGVSKIKKDN
ncbi:head GIN domain-containing protein [Butyricimonas hominis]|uniref:head GIN domain-containing protein n=1 Tax=Butyricimonas TaxID=574697 RepID=UPI0035130D8D